SHGTALNGATLNGATLDDPAMDVTALVADAAEQDSYPESRASAGGRARISFVGAGPGDPDLLTVRAAALLADADVLVVGSRLRARFEPRCHERVQVIELGLATPADELPDPADAAAVPGIAAGAHPLACIDEVAAAVRDGKSVVRLLDGDPCLFGSFEAEATA